MSFSLGQTTVKWQVKERAISLARLGYDAVPSLKVDLESLVADLVILTRPSYPNAQDAV